MRTIRVHTPAALEAHTEVELDPRASHRLSRVLRRRVGDPVTLFNGDGREARAELLAVDARCSRVRIEAVVPVDRESPLVVHLVQAVAKGDPLPTAASTPV